MRTLAASSLVRPRLPIVLVSHSKSFRVALAKILGPGFGCKLLGHDLAPNQDCLDLGLRYVSLGELVAGSDIVSLHAPLVPGTIHLIKEQTIALMKKGVMLINTSRGGLVDTQAVIEAVKAGKIKYLGLDVYEEESQIFFDDLSLEVIPDDVFSRLLTFPNVVITGHQGFLTKEALEQSPKRRSNFAGSKSQNHPFQ